MNELRKRLADSLLEMKAGTITFRSYVEKDKAKKHLYTPRKDVLTNWYFGVPRVTKELKESGLPYVDPINPLDSPISHIIIEHGSTLDLSSEAHRFILQWLVYQDSDKGIALSIEEGKAQQGWDFYIYDEILDQNREAREFDDKFRAMTILKETSDAMLSTYARLLGTRFDNKAPGYIRMWLQQLIDGKIKPKTHLDFLAIVDDKRKDVKMFAKKLLDSGVLVINSKTKEIKYEDIVISKSEEGLYTWLEDAAKQKNGDNKDLYILFKEKTLF